MIRTILALFVCFFAWTELLADTDKIDSLSKVLLRVQDSVKVKVLLAIATEYEYVDHDKAFQFARQAQELSESISYHKGTIRSQYELAILSFLDGDRPSALPYIQKGIALADQIDDELSQASGYFHLSHYHEEEGNFTEALDYLDKAMTIYQAHAQLAQISRCYTGFGGIYNTLGQYELALSNYFLSLSIKDSINDQRGISIVLSNIGSVYLITSKHAEARDYFLKSLEIDRANEDQEGIVVSLTKVGVTHQKSGEFELALAYYDTALALAKKLDFKIDESILLGNIGSTLMEMDKMYESLEYLFASFNLKMGLDRKGSAAHTSNDICEAYMKLGNAKEAKKYAVQAIDLAKNINIDQYREGLKLLAACEYALMDFKNAYDHMAQYQAITDSLFTIESEGKIHEMEVKYQSEKKEQEIKNLMAINEKVRYRNISFAGAAISFLILGALLYYVQNLRVRRNRILLAKEKELDQMKSRFFANISHEFRTPLTLILGPLDDLISETETPESRKKLTVMQRNAGRLLDLVNQLLDLSKIESGKLTLNISRTDIIPVIKGVTMSFHSVAEQKDIQLHLDVHPETLEMNYDLAKFETIITNLLSNAFKFTGEHGKISIISRIIKNGGKSGEREFLRITVTDNGQGISEAEVGLIFDRFYQSDTNQLMQQEGSGIGLALTKELVELHQGNIRAVSTVGEGTQITIELPMDLPLNDGQQVISEVSRQEKASRIHEVVVHQDDNDENPTGNRAIVLVVEDHEDVRHYIHEILSKEYDIISAIDGEDGIARAIESIPDLIISDVMMPKKDGFEVCTTLKNDEKTSHIPIILLTAKSDSDDKITGLSTKADDYVTKPFVPRELLLRVGNLIESRNKLREKYKKEGVLRPKDMQVNSIDEQFLNRLIEIVENNMGDELFGVEQLGSELGMSRSQLHRKLTGLLGQGPNIFIRTFRLQRAHYLLKQKAATASEIAYKVGFGSPSYFTKCFHEHFGYTPSEMPVDK